MEVGMGTAMGTYADLEGHGAPNSRCPRMLQPHPQPSPLPPGHLPLHFTLLAATEGQ